MNPIDQVPILLVMLVATLAQVLFIEVGFRYGFSRRTGPVKAQMAQVRAIMTLITDLDRPNMTLFKMNQDLLVELENRMEVDFKVNPAGGD